jgi:hypothetical protein
LVKWYTTLLEQAPEVFTDKTEEAAK